jgi:predicted aconitase with swiveling domain
MTISARTIVPGHAEAEALVSRQPLNFLAALKGAVEFRHRRGKIEDPDHDLYGVRTAGKILVLPRCIGSTMSSLLFLELAAAGNAPAALVFAEADEMMVAGGLMGELWFDRPLPIVDRPAEDIFAHVRTGMRISLQADEGGALISLPER